MPRDWQDPGRKGTQRKDLSFRLFHDVIPHRIHVMYGKWILSPKLTASLHLKTDGWKTFVSFRGPAYFQGLLLVSGNVCIHENPQKTKCKWGKKSHTYMDPFGHTAEHIYRAHCQHLSQWDCGVNDTSPTLHVEGKTAKLCKTQVPRTTQFCAVSGWAISTPEKSTHFGVKAAGLREINEMSCSMFGS